MSRVQREQLSGSDALLVLDAIQDCLCAKSDQELCQTVVAHARKLFDFDHVSITFGDWQAAQRLWRKDSFFCQGIPCGFWTAYERTDWLTDPVVENLLDHQHLQHWSLAKGPRILANGHQGAPSPHPAVRMWADLGVRSGYSCGAATQRNDGQGSSMVTFFQRREEPVELRIAQILAQLTPHLHQALTRTVRPDGGHSPPPPLSSRENEVLNWLGAGKSSWDISMVLGISERTVNFHVYNLMRKLGAINRPQAVAIAASHGLIGLD